jgi:predicted transcriptional regulator
VKLKPHPFALMLPPLTEEEYAALRADIRMHGILVPVITDQDDLVLDGIHRCRIADELGIEPPVSQMGQMSEERKMHLAVGLNMRRRHLDAERRRELVRKLHEEQGLTVRKIAEITGWSKSTVDRDLKTSPFEEVLAKSRESTAEMRRIAEQATNEGARELFDAFAEISDSTSGFFGLADATWKRGSWPPPPEEHVELTVGLYDLASALRTLTDVLATEDKDAQTARIAAREDTERKVAEWAERWESMDPDERRRRAERLKEQGLLWDPAAVPDGTPS